MNTIHIVIAHHERLFRSGIRSLLNKESNFNVISEAENGKKLLVVLQKSKSIPDIILLDLRVHKREGITAIEEIHRTLPNAKIIALTSALSGTVVSNMLGAGISSCLLKNTSPETLIRTINEAYTKSTFCNEKEIQTQSATHKIPKRDLNKITHTQLSKREIDVLALICAQHTTSEVADKLFISPRTVDGHRNNLLLKTQSRNIAGLVLYGIEKSLIKI